jgi:flagellar biosynthesis protein FlhB
LGPGLFHWCRDEARGRPVDDAFRAHSPTSEAFLHLAHSTTIDVLLVLLPTLAILSVGSVLASVAMGGLTFTPAGLRLKWDAINPVRGLEKMFSKRSLVHALLSMVKLLFVGVIVWVYLRDQLEALTVLRWAWSTQIITATAGILLGLVLRVAVAILIIGLADAFYQKWQHVQELKMTREEVKQERKDTDGAPEVKGRIRRLQIEMSMKRLRQDVPKASVILVNPTHVAVALRYEAKTMEAPILLAKGADHMAERIVKIARSYGIPIVQRPQIARAIFATVKPGQPIPEALYMAVAEVLAMLYRLRQKRRMHG